MTTQEKYEKKRANIGCLSVILLFLLALLFIPSNPEPQKTQSPFELITSYDNGKNVKIKCVYTTCKNFEIIKKHAMKWGQDEPYSLVIIYFNNKKDIPKKCDVNFVMDENYLKNAIATYKKYGRQNEEFTIIQKPK